MYGYQIEVVEGGYIVTINEPGHASGPMGSLGLPKQYRFIFEELEDLLTFLRFKLGK